MTAKWMNQSQSHSRFFNGAGLIRSNNNIATIVIMSLLIAPHRLCKQNAIASNTHYKPLPWSLLAFKLSEFSCVIYRNFALLLLNLLRMLLDGGDLNTIGDFLWLQVLIFRLNLWQGVLADVDFGSKVILTITYVLARKLI